MQNKKGFLKLNFKVNTEQSFNSSGRRLISFARQQYECLQTFYACMELSTWKPECCFRRKNKLVNKFEQKAKNVFQKDLWLDFKALMKFSSPGFLGRMEKASNKVMSIALSSQPASRR